MLERSRQSANHFKSQVLPKLDRPLIRTDHEIELHGAKSGLGRAAHRVLAHRACNAATFRSRGGDVAAVGHVPAAPSLIPAKIICSKDAAITLVHKRLISVREPVPKSVLPAQIAFEGIRLPETDHRLENFPNRFFVAVARGANCRGPMFRLGVLIL